ncbi:GAF domain-containing protein [Occallatibacter savannae]|uniref:GAF domain-containing protein n=1 Tax=Occallatibacter savannae TaxID=1002691 RepID=UPI0013A580D1|nr:GAF domain-containing protein [Occallatibacter savannae]
MTDEYLAKMLGVACEQAEAQGATLFVVDQDVLKPYIIYNLPAEYTKGIGTVRVGEQCCGRAVAHKRPWIVTDMLTDPLFTDGRKGATDSPIRAAFSVPVIDGDDVIASLACHFTKPHTPSPLDIERNEVFANLFAISLRGRRPFVIEKPIHVQSPDRPAIAAD